MTIFGKIFIFSIIALINFNSLLFAFTYYWGAHPDKERVVFKFDTTVPSKFEILRKNKDSIQLNLSNEFLSKEPIPKSQLVKNMTILKSININNATIKIYTHTPDFKVEWFVLKEEKKLVVDLLKQPYNEKNIQESNELTISEGNNTTINATNKTSTDNSSLLIKNKNEHNSTFYDNSSMNYTERQEIKSFAVKGFINKNATIYNPNREYYPQKIEKKEDYIQLSKKKNMK